MSPKAIKWFDNYLSDRTKSVRVDGVSSNSLFIQNGVPQGSILGPILFTIYINDLCQNVTNAKCHFYADNTVLYCSVKIIQQNLQKLRLVLNPEKTKMMCFSKSRKTEDACPIATLDEKVIE